MRCLLCVEHCAHDMPSLLFRTSWAFVQSFWLLRAAFEACVFLPPVEVAGVQHMPRIFLH